MTRIVVTAFGDTPDALYDAARKAEPHADWIEIRLDGPSGLPWDLRSFFSFAKPCIATVRHTLDGGRSGADDATRAALLRRAVLAGATAIDVEAWSDEAPRLVKEARGHGVTTIVSEHMPDTPSDKALLEALRGMRALGADVAKLATRAGAPHDVATLARAAQLARDEGLPFALMAVEDPFLRYAAPAFGMRLAYAHAPGAPAAAPGQPAADALRAAHAQLGDARRFACLLGHPVSHSKSPPMQNMAFVALAMDERYAAFDVAPEQLAGALAGLRESGALGCNLTIPHKEAAVPLMDALDEDARAAGAVNTVVVRAGKLVGHNTDGAGALDALAEAGAPAEGAVLLLGAGGTARAIAAALRRAGRRVTVANRTHARAERLAREIGAAVFPWSEAVARLPTFPVVIHATSVGLVDDATPFDHRLLARDATLLDCVYRAGGTALVRRAHARGVRAIPGEAMLLHQGARAFALWTGREAPIDDMREALA
ncbi:MAG TPA: shikimate dehydrogenase [Candidatus Thermoplasmatota archaeon]|nr:shikimate dehydrogenase [Candidatus Thermoplasmatota archaeon]